MISYLAANTLPTRERALAKVVAAASVPANVVALNLLRENPQYSQNLAAARISCRQSGHLMFSSSGVDRTCCSFASIILSAASTPVGVRKILSNDRQSTIRFPRQYPPSLGASVS